MLENSEPDNHFGNYCCVTRGLNANVRACGWKSGRNIGSVKEGHLTGAHRESGL